ncbi:MAG: hypothetical protein JWM12_2495 [Ilumatobacteraceae bacterium]|nr:hypothetical protein [Ilumatobacteraceae bacterium]
MQREVLDRPAAVGVHPPQRSHRGLVLWVVVVALVAAFAITKRSDVAAAIAAMRRANTSWIVVGVALSALTVVNLAGLQGRSQALLGIHRSFRRTLRLTAGGHALDLVTKAGGMAGALRFGADARRQGQSAQRATAGCILAELSTHLGFTMALVVVIPVAVERGALTVADVVAVGIYLAITSVFLATVVAAARSQRAIRLVAAIPHRLTDLWCCVRRHPSSPRPRDTQAADDLHLAVSVARRDRRNFWPIAAHAALWPLIGMALLGSACAAVGVHASLTTVLITYCMATTFSIIGLLPGGLGFAEVSMAATLGAFGVDAGHAVAVIALYRVFDLWLPLVGGAVTLRSARPLRT